MDSCIKGIHHAALKCCGMGEYEKTVAFYRDVLKLPVKRSWGEGVKSGIMLDTGAGLIEIFASGESRLETGSIRHFAFSVSDTDAVAEAVRRAGYAITDEPHDIVIPSEIPFPARIAFCIGPVGEEIEIFQEK